jgi:hypothetical protein
VQSNEKTFKTPKVFLVHFSFLFSFFAEKNEMGIFLLLLYTEKKLL